MFQGGLHVNGRQRQVSVSRGPERPDGPHGAVGRSRASLRADPHALRGDDAGTLPAAVRAPGGEQDVNVDAAVALLGIYGGGCLRLHGQLHSVHKEPRRQATHDGQPQDLPPDRTADGSLFVTARAPLQEDGGERRLLVIVDCFSKITRAILLQRIDAETIAAAFLGYWVLAYGPWAMVLSDNGPQFRSPFFQGVCSLLEVSNRYFTTYHPEANGQVEWVNWIIVDKLLTYVEDHQDRWDELVLMLTLAYSSRPQHSTGVAPLKLFMLKCHAQRRCKPSCCKKQNSRNQVLTGFEPPTPGREPKVTPNESGCLLPTRLPMRLPHGLVTAGAFDICTRAILSEIFAISHFLFLRF